MKLSTNIIKTNGLKIAWLVCGLFVAWVTYSQFRLIDEAVLRPPLVQDNQVTARQSKINQKLLDQIANNHALKKAINKLNIPTRDPFSPGPGKTEKTTE